MGKACSGFSSHHFTASANEVVACSDAYVSSSCCQPTPAPDAMHDTDEPSGMFPEQALEEVAGADEIHDRGLQVGERRPREPRAAEHRVDRPVDLGHDAVDRRLVEQVDRE